MKSFSRPIQLQIAVGKKGGEHQGYRSWARYFYALHDAHFNVMAVVNRDGRTVERYAYTPYGERTVYAHGWHSADINGDGEVDVVDLNKPGLRWGQTSSKDEEWDEDLTGDGTVDILDLNLFSAYYSTSDPVNYDFAGRDPMVSYPTLTSFRGVGGFQEGVALCAFGHQGLVHDEAVSLIQNRARMLHARLGRFMQRDSLGYPDGPNAYVGYHVMWGGVDPFGLRTADLLWIKIPRRGQSEWRGF